MLTLRGPPALLEVERETLHRALPPSSGPVRRQRRKRPVGPAGVAIAKGVLELQPCQGEVNRNALVELAFRASLGRAGERVVQRWNA